MSFYKRHQLLPIGTIPMEDLPMKAPTTKAQSEKSAVAKASTTRSSTAKPTTRRRSTTTRAKTAKSGTRPVKPMPQEQPRDSLGRFARKTGQVLWAGVKTAGRAVVGTAKGIRKAHRTVKCVHAGYRRRARLEEREKHIALAEREHKLGLRKKVVRRRKR